MAICIQVLMICFVFGTIAGVYQLFLWRKDTSSKKYKIPVVMFYIHVFYGVLSFFKVILGDKDITLFESFEDISIRTYYHYAIPLVVISIVLPVMISIVLRNGGSHILYVSNSWIFMLCAVFYAVVGKISNLSYLCIVVICLFLTPISVRILEIKNDIALKIRYVAPVTAFWLVTVVVYIPGEIYLNNIWEFPMAPGRICLGGILAIACISVYIICMLYFLTNWQAKILSRIIFVLVFMGYLQNIFLNGSMGAMDGTRQAWSWETCIVNTIIWIVVLLCIMLCEKVSRKNIDRIIKTICIYIGMVELVSLLIVTCTTSGLHEAQKQYGTGHTLLTREDIFEFSPDNNVVVFVLDWYDEQILEQILGKDKDFLRSLDGFTYYGNTTSLYAYTSMSIPYLLTGIEWQYNMSEHEYCQYAFENGTMLDDMKNAGYDVRVYTDTSNLADETVRKFSNSALFDYETDAFKQLSVMTKMARYQMAPFLLKRYYWYEPQEIQKMFIVDDDVYHADSVTGDMELYNSLLDLGVQVDHDKEKTFKFIHMYGAHPPFGVDESSDNPYNAAMLSRAKNAMEIVFEYLNQMKAIGVYDSSTIIITADHGENYMYDVNEIDELSKLCLDETSSPILFVKNRNQGEGLIYSDAPVSHREVVAEIMKAINPQQNKYGNTLDDIAEGDNRERTFICKKRDAIYVKVLINGDVRDAANWCVIENGKGQE